MCGERERNPSCAGQCGPTQGPENGDRCPTKAACVRVSARVSTSATVGVHPQPSSKGPSTHSLSCTRATCTVAYANIGDDKVSHKNKHRP